MARRLPKTHISPLDSFVTTLTYQPEEAAAVLHGMLVGPITPTYEERHSIEAPALVIGHKADFIHPFTDADHLTRQLPNARLVQARSIMELRVFPARLTAEDRRVPRRCLGTAALARRFGAAPAPGRAGLAPRGAGPYGSPGP